MILICYFSFLTTYSLISLLPSTFPSHYCTKTVSGQSCQILWLLSVLIFLHLLSEVYTVSTSPWPVFSGCHGTSLQPCRLADPSQIPFRKCWCSPGHPPEHPCPFFSFLHGLWSASWGPVSSVVIHPLRVPPVAASPPPPALFSWVQCPQLFTGLLLHFPPWLVFLVASSKEPTQSSLSRKVKLIIKIEKMGLRELKTEMQPGFKKGPELESPGRPRKPSPAFSDRCFPLCFFCLFGRPSFSPKDGLYSPVTLILTVVFQSIFKFLGK